MDLGDPVPAELKPISNSEPPVYFVRILYLSLIKYTGGVKMTSPRVARFELSAAALPGLKSAEVRLL